MIKGDVGVGCFVLYCFTIYPVIYDDINEDVILKAAVHINGAGGISSLDSTEWRKILGSNIYGNSATDLRRSIADLAKQLCSSEIDDLDSIQPPNGMQTNTLIKKSWCTSNWYR